jgi:hypothetical protein
MVDAKPDGEHMTMETFKKVVSFVSRNTLPIILISGGEPTEHPQILEFLKLSKENFKMVILLSNGTFIGNVKLRDAIIGLGICVQVTNDPRYYKTKVEKFEHPLFTYEDHIRTITALGRAIENEIPSDRTAPMCFNLRSTTRTCGSITEGINIIRQRMKMCTPSINIDGSIVAGETPFCYKIGSVDSTLEELTNNVCNMKCNKCGLEDNLGVLYKNAIGYYE